MATTLKTDRIENLNPAAAYSAAPTYPTAVGVEAAEDEKTLTTVAMPNFFGTRLRTRIGSALTPSISPATGWGAGAGVSVLDLYSASSGPSIRLPLAHLHTAVKTTPTNTDINAISDSIIFSGGGGQEGNNNNGRNGLPIIAQGIATNSNGTVIAKRLFVRTSHSTDTGTSAFLYADGVTFDSDSPNSSSSAGHILRLHARSTAIGAGPSTYVAFRTGPTNTGSITTPGASTTYSTSSDYRLKENITPIETGLDIISALKPRSWKWKDSEELGIGFIAHEVQEDAPEVTCAVTGEKDEVTRLGKLIDANGDAKLIEDSDQEMEVVEPSEDQAAAYAAEGYTWTHTRDVPIYQSMDTSFMVAPLVAAIKELKAIVDQQQVQITTLEQRIVALETA